MKLALTLVVTLGLSAQGMGQPVRLRVVGDIQVSHKFESIPTWSGNALISIEGSLSGSPSVWVFDAEGRQLAQIAVVIPSSSYVEVRAAWHGSDGTTAICGAANDEKGHRAGFLALASAAGKIESLIRTEPYSPTAVAIAPDGTVWMKGVEYLPVERKPSKTRNGILRHFDRSGKLMASFLPQSDFILRELFGGIDQLAVNSARVGWYNGGGATTYFEVVGDQLERYPAVQRLATDAEKVPGAPMQSYQISGLAITDDDRVFVTSSVNGKNPRVFTLDRLSRSWLPVALPDGGEPPLTNWLLGGNGTTLVFRTKQQSSRMRRLEIFSQ